MVFHKVLISYNYKIIESELVFTGTLLSFAQMLKRNSRGTHTATRLFSIMVLQSKISKLLCVFICLMTKMKGLQSQEIITITQTIFCYNSSLEGEYTSHYACEMSRSYIAVVSPDLERGRAI